MIPFTEVQMKKTIVKLACWAMRISRDVWNSTRYSFLLDHSLISVSKMLFLMVNWNRRLDIVMGLLPGKKLLRRKVITLAIRNQFLMVTSLVLLEVFPGNYKSVAMCYISDEAYRVVSYTFSVFDSFWSALAFLPDELREKLIDKQETREKFQKLHSSVHALSTEVAMKRFYETLTTKQGEEKSGEEGPDSCSDSGSGSGVNVTTDLGSYVTELSSLLDKSPTIEVKFDT